MPRITQETICKEWQLSDSEDKRCYGYAPSFLESERFHALEPGFLYYYSYASPNEPFEKLGAFEKLKFPIMGISIHEDRQFGWVIHIRHHDRNLFPSTGQKINLEVDGNEYICEILEVQRVMATGASRNSSGEWGAKYDTVSLTIIRCINSPKIIYEWFCSYFDVKSIPRHHESIDRSDFSKDLGFFVFIERLSENRYRLLLNFYQYKPFKKG